MNQKKLANLGLFAAVAIIFGYVESLIPFFAGIPGMKLGLANLAVLFILEKYTWKEAALVSVIRIFIIGFMFGNLFSILYSLAGAALSLTVMTVMKKKSDFSILGISVAGGVSHNIGQLLIACLITMTSGLIYYAPALLISGVITGLLIGTLTNEVLKRIHFLGNILSGNNKTLLQSRRSAFAKPQQGFLCSLFLFSILHCIGILHQFKSIF